MNKFTNSNIPRIESQNTQKTKNKKPKEFVEQQKKSFTSNRSSRSGSVDPKHTHTHAQTRIYRSSRKGKERDSEVGLRGKRKKKKNRVMGEGCEV